MSELDRPSTSIGSVSLSCSSSCRSVDLLSNFQVELIVPLSISSSGHNWYPADCWRKLNSSMVLPKCGLLKKKKMTWGLAANGSFLKEQVGLLLFYFILVFIASQAL